MVLKKYYLKDILAIAPVEVRGNVEFMVSSFRPIDEADESSLVWINHLKIGWENKIASTRARVIVCARDAVMDAEYPTVTWLVTDSPRLTFLRIVSGLTRNRINPSIHPSSYVHQNANIGKDVHIGPFCYVGESKIGEGTVLVGHNHIYEGVQIGCNVTIHAGTVVGSDGFGYERNESGELEKFPHIGGVIIEDGVEIGSNTCIDRGALGNTLVKEGARIDNLVHIAHNVVVGRNAAVIAHAMVGGSTIIGDNAWIAPSACLRNGIAIGSNATIGLAALVTKNIPDGETWAGFPAKSLRTK